MKHCTSSLINQSRKPLNNKLLITYKLTGKRDLHLVKLISTFSYFRDSFAKNNLSCYSPISLRIKLGSLFVVFRRTAKGQKPQTQCWINRELHPTCYAFRVESTICSFVLAVWTCHSRGEGVLPYLSYIGMCRPKGYGF